MDERGQRIRVLCVEDDESLRELLRRALQAEGFEVDDCGCWRDADELLRVARYDAILLDRGLPDGDALLHVRALKARRDQTPIVMLTGRAADDAIIAGYAAGVSLYLAKPVSGPVLATYLRAHLAPKPQAALVVGPLSLDPTARTVSVAGEPPVRPSPQAFDLLWELAARAGTVVSRGELLVKVARKEDVGDNIIDVLVHEIRRDVLGDKFRTMLRSERKHGYRLLADPESAPARTRRKRTRTT